MAKLFVREYWYQAGEADSKLTCRTIALEEVKRILLEEIGAYLESTTEIKNLEITKDEITTITAGILQTEIKKESWDGQTYYLKAEIVADPETVATMVSGVIQDKDLMKELQETKEKAAQAMAEVERLKKELALERQKTETGNIHSDVKSDPEASKKEVSRLEGLYAMNVNELAAADLFERAHALRVSEKYKEAIKVLTKAIEVKPDFARAYANRGVCYFKLNKLKNALKDLDKAIELDPSLAGAFAMRGAALRKLSKFNPALADLNHAIELDSGLAKAYFQRALLLKDLGRKKEALDDLRKASSLGDKKAEELLKKIK